MGRCCVGVAGVMCAEVVCGEWHESAGACLRIFGLAIM